MPPPKRKKSSPTVRLILTVSSLIKALVALLALFLFTMLIALGLTAILWVAVVIRAIIGLF